MMWVVYTLAAWKAINITVGIARFVKEAFFTKSPKTILDEPMGRTGVG